MARKRKLSPLSINPAPVERWRYHGEVEGNSRVIFDLLAAQSNDKMIEVLSRMDPEEDFHLVHIDRHENPAQGITSTGRATPLAQVLLRYGDERLLEAGFLALLKDGHHKIEALGETLKLGKYDWFEKVVATIGVDDHETMSRPGHHDHAYGPLFYWAVSPPLEGQEQQYAAALDALLRLPPYGGRSDLINQRLPLAFDNACEGNNVAALDELFSRGLKPTPRHLPLAIANCNCEAVDWLVKHGVLVEFNEQVPPDDHCSPVAWAQALLDTRFVSNFQENHVDSRQRLMRLAAQLFALPVLGEQVEKFVAASADDGAWSAQLLAASLENSTPRQHTSARHRRI